MNYPIMHLQHSSLSVVRQYTETSQQCKMETPRRSCLLCSYSQLDKHISRLAASAITDDRRCRSGRDRRWFGRTASPASKAFNESHMHCLHCPTLPTSPDVSSITVLNILHRWVAFLQAVHTPYNISFLFS